MDCTARKGLHGDPTGTAMPAEPLPNLQQILKADRACSQTVLGRFLGPDKLDIMPVGFKHN